MNANIVGTWLPKSHCKKDTKSDVYMTNGH